MFCDEERILNKLVNLPPNDGCINAEIGTCLNHTEIVNHTLWYLSIAMFIIYNIVTALDFIGIYDKKFLHVSKLFTFPI